MKNDQMKNLPIKNRIFVSIDGLVGQRKEWFDHGETVVFTNGVFDLIHQGHLHYLYEAAALGDRLIVGVNSDASTKRLKGDDRPINDEASRLVLLASLRMIDAVILFEEDTPFNLIQSIKPDVLVKGGDYAVNEIVGADIVKDNGGRVVSLSFLEGFSSSAIIQKIKRLKQ